MKLLQEMTDAELAGSVCLDPEGFIEYVCLLFLVSQVVSTIKIYETDIIHNVFFKQE